MEGPSTIRSRIQDWHGGQLVIAWILLGIAGVAICTSWFLLLDPIGHGDYPNRDRAACLRPAPKAKGDIATIAIVSRAVVASRSATEEEVIQQLGLVPNDTARFVAAGGKIFPFTAVSDTQKMLTDLNRFAVYEDSIDTLTQNAYLSVRGLRLDRDCVRARYAAGDRRIGVLTWITGVLLVGLPLLGLLVTWIWLAGRTGKGNRAAGV